MNTPEEFFDKVREITRRLDMKEYIAQLTARQMIEMIANDYVEESHDKMRMQIHDHILWCKEWLEVNPVIESPLDEVRRKWQERKEIGE